MITQQKDLTGRFVRPDMDPQKLQHFLAVYRYGNFRRAAEDGRVTQQAVSKAVARLEDQLGLKLFERTTLGATPTVYAHTLARHAKVIVSEIRLAAAELSAMRGSTLGFVQVGIGWSFIPRIGPEAIEEFRRQRPGIGLRIVGGYTGSLYPQLLRGDLDLVVSAPPEELPIDEDLKTQELFTEQDIIGMRKNHPLASRSSIELSDLSQCVWLMTLAFPQRWNSICEAFVRKGISPPSDVIDVDSLSMAKSMLVRGDYVCLISNELVATELDLGALISFRMDDLPTQRPALLATRKGLDLQPAAKVFKSILLDICGQLYPNEPISR